MWIFCRIFKWRIFGEINIGIGNQHTSIIFDASPILPLDPQFEALFAIV